jgi:uncharacterized protein YndB with AHSA1/START domain
MSKVIRELTIERIISAPTDNVFNAWLDPGLLSKWWGPYGVTTPICEIDARDGGLINIVMLAGLELGELSGSEWPITGTFQEIITPTKIIYLACPTLNDRPIMDTINTVNFERYL